MNSLTTVGHSYESKSITVVPVVSHHIEPERRDLIAGTEHDGSNILQEGRRNDPNRTGLETVIGKKAANSDTKTATQPQIAPDKLNCSFKNLCRPWWSSVYHTRLWIRGSRVRSRPRSMDFFRV